MDCPELIKKTVKLHLISEKLRKNPNHCHENIFELGNSTTCHIQFMFYRLVVGFITGQYDYTCPMASRVTWGCVVSVTSLEDAKSFCNQDPSCQSFVVFSSNPEIDGN